MIETAKTVLLGGIFCLLLWMATHPVRPVGRFVSPSGDATDILLDTSTGRACTGYDQASDTIPACTTLK